MLARSAVRRNVAAYFFIASSCAASPACSSTTPSGSETSAAFSPGTALSRSWKLAAAAIAAQPMRAAAVACASRSPACTSRVVVASAFVASPSSSRSRPALALDAASPLPLALSEMEATAALWPSQSSSCVFCPSCGAIMDEPTHSNTEVVCRLCSTSVPSRVFEEIVVTSAGKEHNVQHGRAAADAGTQGRQARAVAQEACPKCGHPELQYYTMQLRSADEGQTVFYECEKCGHTFSTNT